MDKFFVQFVYAADIALIGLTLFLSAAIMIYALVRQALEGSRYRRLFHIVSGLQTLAFKDDESMLSGCTVLLKQATPFEFFDILKRQKNIPPGRFVTQLKECIDNSGKIARIEKRARYSISKWRRVEAIVALGYIRSGQSLDILGRSIFDRDADIAYFSLLSLGRIKSVEAARILLAAIKRRSLSGYVIAPILEQFPPSIVEILVNGLKEQDEYVRFWVLKLLSGFKPAQYTPIISQLTRDHSADVRSAACECLGEIADKNTEEAVRACLKDSAWFVRMHAARALEKISEAQCMPDIAPLLKDAHWFVRESVKDIMVTRFDSAFAYVEAFLAQDDQGLRQSCIEIMDRSGYRNKIIKDIIFADPADKDKAGKRLEAMIKAGAHFGLEGILGKYPEDQRQEVLDIIAAVDSDKARHIERRIKGQTQEA